MRTHFRGEQLADPALAEVEKNLRACVHCGICTATCPTYVLLGDERDSPRGRIVMMQKMLEDGGAPSAETVTHLDRCLSCLGCRTACPSGVNYARLIDQSRAHIEQHYRRPLGDRLLRWSIAKVLTRPSLTRLALALARIAAPLAEILPGRLRTMAQKARPRWFLPRVAGGDHAKHGGGGGSFGPPCRLRRHSPRKPGENQFLKANARRIALFPGCIQQVIAPEIDEAIARLLARREIELVSLEEAGCCGALAHHLGRESEAKAWACKMIEAFERGGGTETFEGVLISATGCAAHIHQLEYLFADEPDWQSRARVFSSALVPLDALLSSPAYGGRGSPHGEARKSVFAKTSGETEMAQQQTLPSASRISFARHLPRKRERIDGEASIGSLCVALQVPCSQQHGLRWPEGRELLARAGFDVVSIPEGHLCCGSAGSYSILQPEIANALRERKLANIRSVRPDVIATSNIGCLQHLSGPDAPPIVHIAELLDWAEGGPVPPTLHNRVQLMTRAEPVN